MKAETLRRPYLQSSCIQNPKSLGTREVYTFCSGFRAKLSVGCLCIAMWHQDLTDEAAIRYLAEQQYLQEKLDALPIEDVDSDDDIVERMQRQQSGLDTSNDYMHKGGTMHRFTHGHLKACRRTFRSETRSSV